MNWFTKKDSFFYSLYSKLSYKFNYNSLRVKNYTYNLNDIIGKGQNGIVYKGINQLTSQIVAVKRIDISKIKDRIMKEMLDSQIQALKTLKHQNIIQCIDIIHQTEYCYIITQFCNQGDLEELLKQKRRLNQDQTMKILQNIVAGFIQIGKNNFLHRDLKLANIFMCNGKVKIADFGFAKKIKHEYERYQYNIGSAYYMSPEALKRNIYSIKNDIWSIGIMAYQLLHGQTPWKCKNQEELMDKMIKNPVIFQDSLDISDQIKYFITRCLQIEYNNRMSLNELQQWLKNHQSILDKSNQNKQRINLNSKLRLSKNYSSFQNKNAKILSELTNNRLNQRNHKNNLFGSSNIHDKQNWKNQENHAYKENRSQSINKRNQSSTKLIVQRNKSIIAKEINFYRILYKILQRLKKQQPEDMQLLSKIEYDMIKKITNLTNSCVNGVQKNLSAYQLKQIQLYFSEVSNPSIKKYKQLMSQYFKKHKSQIKNVQTNLKFKLLNEAIENKFNPIMQYQILMNYWMVEYLHLIEANSKRQNLKES